MNDNAIIGYVMNRNILNRIDLSNWVIHFVHQRKSEDNPQDLQDIAELEGFDGDLRLPDYYDDEGNGHSILSPFEENEYWIDENASAFDVLLKILHDGFIHSGWSLRNFIPTIYGPKSAVCLTEMPLYALVEYAKFRGRYSGYVGNYGIAFRRNELFAAGGRPVIYGLSREPVEAETTPDGVYQGRILDIEKTGMPLCEQYRYVKTQMLKSYDHSIHPVDWTHEREWRWALLDDSMGVPGLPFFLSKEHADFFSDIVIIVGTEEERNAVLSHLKNLYDSGGTNTGLNYNIKMIAAAKVLALDSLASMSPEEQVKIRIDDLDLKQIPVMPTITVREEVASQVRAAIEKAGEIAIATVASYLEDHLEFDEQKGYLGWATVCTDVQSEVTQAMQNIGVCHTYSDGVYRISINDYRTCNLELLEMGAREAAAFLEQELGQHFYVMTRMD